MRKIVFVLFALLISMSAAFAGVFEPDSSSIVFEFKEPAAILEGTYLLSYDNGAISVSPSEMPLLTGDECLAVDSLLNVYADLGDKVFAILLWDIDIPAGRYSVVFENLGDRVDYLSISVL